MLDSDDWSEHPGTTTSTTVTTVTTARVTNRDVDEARIWLLPMTAMGHPTAPPDPNTPSARAGPDRRDGQLPCDAGGVRVLVIEDDPAIANGVRDALCAEGFEVECVHDGVTGFERALAETFDLVVLDIMLPRRNGYRVCQQLREAEVWTPVLMLTAKSGDHDVAEGLELGADDFLTKPFSMVVLVARVHALLRRSRHRTNLVVAGELRLDTLHRRAFCGDHPVPLTARETELLAYLMQRPDETVTKAELVTGVWGEGFGGDPNIVEVYISHLRQKVDDPFGRTHLETVRGRGYRLATRPAPHAR